MAAEDPDDSVVHSEVFHNLGNDLLDALNKQRHSGTFCDCVLVVEGSSFPAHASVIGASSDLLLQELLRVRENNFSKLHLENVTYQGFLPLLDYMYSGVLKLNIRYLQEVRSCALTLGLNNQDKIFSKFGTSHRSPGVTRSVDLAAFQEKDFFEDLSLQQGYTKTNDVDNSTSAGMVKLQDHRQYPDKGFPDSQHAFGDDLSFLNNLQPNSVADTVKISEASNTLHGPHSNKVVDLQEQGQSKKANVDSRLIFHPSSEVPIPSSSVHTDIGPTSPLISKDIDSDAQQNNLETSFDSDDEQIASKLTSENGNHPKKKSVENDIEENPKKSRQRYGSLKMELRKCRKPKIIYDESVEPYSPGNEDTNEDTLQSVIADDEYDGAKQAKSRQKRKRSTPKKLRRQGVRSKKGAEDKKVDKAVTKDTKESRQKIFKCFLCPRRFFREVSLKNHCEGHAFGGIHKCHVCGRCYVRLCDFTRHVRSHGTLRCEYCEFCTKSQKIFVEHNQSKHNSPKPFRCHFFGCSFASGKLHDLDEHRLIHSQVKCFTCDYCGKTFAQKGGLYSHKKSCLQKRGFLCDICGRAFNHLGSMKSHRRIHVGEKPYQCPECNTCFSDHRNLKRHKRIHENIFPYACGYCDKRFRHSNSRKSHINKQHFPSESYQKSPSKPDYIATSCDLTSSSNMVPPMNSYLMPLQPMVRSHLMPPGQQVFTNQNIPHPVFPVASESQYSLLHPHQSSGVQI